MGVEIERKFRVTSDAWRATADDGVALDQGYLSDDPDRVVRVRVAGTRAFLTIKGRGATPDTRPEFEYPIPRGEAVQLLGLTKARLQKVRYLVPAVPATPSDDPDDELTWEIDVFAGALDGLVLAEIELPTADAPFPRPPWLGEDVTADPRWTNARLARDGRPD